MLPYTSIKTARLPRRLSPIAAAVGLILFAAPPFGLFATSAFGQTVNSVARLQLLVNDTAAQLRLSYRQEPVELQQRRLVLGQAIAAWNKSARSDRDNHRLSEWLREAMRLSMPGSHEPLPPLPEFPLPATPAVRLPPAEATPATSEINGQPAPSDTGAAPESGIEDTAPEHVDAENRGPSAAGVSGEPQQERRPVEGATLETAPAVPPMEAAEPAPTATTSEKADTVRRAGDQAAAAVAPPAGDIEGDPFRDDPLPFDLPPRK